ncbi:MAG: DNA mismatch repair endonuclease MutL [Planctomycetales bacterium]|nr:DNA mismatch repair endonuclease MutL [bacterium]UNM09224.1 MAG: DNA mismatch repair endonuclease MutL [Planctomycetales bacterium]
MEEAQPRQPIMALSEQEARRISAGEVVERPVNVVKELVENALDAGATQVTVELEDGGRQLIRVTDNGHGIPASELPLAVLPHHTSKIRSLDDVFGLSSLGFRGEALASIAAVSRLRIASHHADDELGTALSLDPAGLSSTEPVNLQGGTEVEVRELFHNTPARLKFLRSRQSESAQVGRMLVSYAIAWPEVRWELLSAGRSLLSTDGSGDRRQVLSDLIEPGFRHELHELDYEFPPSAVHGLISDPTYHRNNRSRQWFFINRRPVTNRLLYKAVDDAMREFLSSGKYPAGAFFLELPPEEIDVNVHPMKLEVSFSQPQAVYTLLSTAVRRGMNRAAGERQGSLRSGLSSVVRQLDAGMPGRPVDSIERRRPNLSLADAARQYAEVSVDASVTPARLEPEDDFAFVPPPIDVIPERRVQLAQDDADAGFADAPQLSLVGQVGNSYLVLNSGERLYVVDQHAAHERILFEKIYEAVDPARASAITRQSLLFPMVVSLDDTESEDMQPLLEALRRVGFNAEAGAGGSLVISEVPQFLRNRINPALMADALEEFSSRGISDLLEDRIKELAASISCRAAIKARMRLTESEQLALLRLLLESWSSLSCPHGRPTIIEIGSSELEKMFLR